MDVLRLYSTLLNNDIRLVNRTEFSFFFLLMIDRYFLVNCQVIVRGLMLMRNRGLIDCIELCQLFFCSFITMSRSSFTCDYSNTFDQ